MSSTGEVLVLKEIEKTESRVIDPRAQILILILINIIGISNDNFWVEILSMVVIGLILTWQGMAKKSLKFALSYAVVWGVFFLTRYYQNIFTAMISIICIMGRKTIPVFMFGSAIITKTKVGKMISAMQKAHIPKGIIIALAVCVRFFPTLKEEYHTVLNAMKMRGVKFSFNNIIIHPALIIENILVPIMLRMSIIVDELSVASVTRGIDSEKERTSYYINRFGFHDFIFLAIFIGLAISTFISWR